MQNKKTVLASAVFLLPLLSNAHPGNHEHVGNASLIHGTSPLFVGFAILLLVAAFAIRKHYNSRNIEQSCD
ncbi:MAG: hypothetical protein ACR2QS_12780 [Woeseiaceae bacterium]